MIKQLALDIVKGHVAFYAKQMGQDYVERQHGIPVAA